MKNAKQLKSHMDDMWIDHMLICAFRYNLGRRSYSPSICMDFLTPLIPYMNTSDLELISREISEYPFDNTQYPDKWYEFKTLINKELTKRSKR